MPIDFKIYSLSPEIQNDEKVLILISCNNADENERFLKNKRAEITIGDFYNKFSNLKLNNIEEGGMPGNVKFEIDGYKYIASFKNKLVTDDKSNSSDIDVALANWFLILLKLWNEKDWIGHSRFIIFDYNQGNLILFPVNTNDETIGEGLLYFPKNKFLMFFIEEDYPTFTAKQYFSKFLKTKMGSLFSYNQQGYLNFKNVTNLPDYWSWSDENYRFASILLLKNISYKLTIITFCCILVLLLILYKAW